MLLRDRRLSRPSVCFVFNDTWNGRQWLFDDETREAKLGRSLFQSTDPARGRVARVNFIVDEIRDMYICIAEVNLTRATGRDVKTVVDRLNITV